MAHRGHAILTCEVTTQKRLGKVKRCTWREGKTAAREEKGGSKKERRGRHASEDVEHPAEEDKGRCEGVEHPGMLRIQ